MARSRLFVVEDDYRQVHPLVIRDIGLAGDVSVTNDAERVVEELVRAGRLPPGRKLLYYDSDGQLDEIVVKDGRFAGFQPGPTSRSKGADSEPS